MICVGPAGTQVVEFPLPLLMGRAVVPTAPIPDRVTKEAVEYDVQVMPSRLVCTSRPAGLDAGMELLPKLACTVPEMFTGLPGVTVTAQVRV